MPPIDVPVPDVNLYRHSRYDEDPAHRWIRGQVLETIKGAEFSNRGSFCTGVILKMRWSL